MNEALHLFLTTVRTALLADVTRELCGRSGSIFRLRGPEATAAALERIFAALLADVAAGTRKKLRAALRPTLLALSDAPINFRDLRVLLEALRGALLARLDGAGDRPPAAYRALEDWCHEFNQQSCLYLISQREETIDRQASEIEMKLAEQRQLSIPIVPIHDGVLVVPLVGALDAHRAQTLTTRVLQAIPGGQARVLLIDVSGVTRLDRDVVEHLFGTARAARLLGSQVVLSGISAEAARRLVALDVEFRDLEVRRSLQDALAYALAALGRRPAAAPPI